MWAYCLCFKLQKGQKCLPSSNVQVINKSSAVLVVHNVTINDAGVYACYVGPTDCYSGLEHLKNVGFSDDVKIECEYP